MQTAPKYPTEEGLTAHTILVYSEHEMSVAPESMEGIWIASQHYRIAPLGGPAPPSPYARLYRFQIYFHPLKGYLLTHER